MASTPVLSKQRWMSSKYRIFPLAMTGIETASLSRAMTLEMLFNNDTKLLKKGVFT